MKKCTWRKLGRCLVCAGIAVILILVLPTTVWWFLLGAALIAGGICVCRKRS